MVVDEYICRINKLEEKYQMVPMMKRRRARSADRAKRTVDKYFELSEQEYDEGKVDPCDPPLHPRKKGRNRRFLKIQSC